MIFTILGILALLLILCHPTGRAVTCSLVYAIFFLTVSFCALAVTGLLMIVAAGAY